VSIQRPDRSAKAVRFACFANKPVSNRPIWLVEAASFATARPPTIQRMAGSQPRRSASFGETPEHSLLKLRDQRMTAILASAAVGEDRPPFSKPQGIIQLAEGE